MCVLVAIYLLAFTNASFWQKLSAYFSDHPAKLIVAAIAILLIHIAVLLALSSKFILKPVLMTMIIVAAAGSYFTDTFGTIIDRNVIDAALTTTRAESGALITPRFFLHLIVYGLIPCAIVIWVRISPGPFFRKLAFTALTCVACLVGAVALIASDYGSYSSMYREHREDIMALLMPSTPIRSLVSYYTHDLSDRGIVMNPLGIDAAQMASVLPSGRNLLTVIVVGETARAANFGLFGYIRDTNPELGKRDAVAFPDATSCGTDTGVSVPCMFSPFKRTEYSHSKFLGSENLLDVLKHAGVQVAWFDNNTGSKGVADRVQIVQMQDANDARFCNAGDCEDDILVEALKNELANIRGNATIVLHMIGSHGPAYYRRYPDAFARFKPDCRTNQFSDCSTEEIVNAYDNSILYTDHVLSEVIDVLKDNEERFASSMIYMSDHGESLGENGLYLHAAPYFIAPKMQTHIPFVAWFSPEFSSATGLDVACLKRGAAEPASHDNLFHTVLGMMMIATSAYDEALDRFAACRRATVSSSGL
ncbi:MAG: sulfatase [Rhizobium sp.]|nr:sulfatase [Rhizobium sp.]